MQAVCYPAHSLHRNRTREFARKILIFPLTQYTKDTVKLKNCHDSKLDSYIPETLKNRKPYIENKIKEQFKDFKYKAEDVKGYGFDKDGNLKLFMFDTYDFNKGENAKVEAGRRLMQKGEMKGFFSMHEILINKNELDNILKNK